MFNELENGNIKIPRFQRGYVWERSKIVKLLNSIYKEHPIGSFFVYADATLYVPIGSKEAYQNHSIWGKFGTIIEE